jgi:hypothetical protein
MSVLQECECLIAPLPYNKEAPSLLNAAVDCDIQGGVTMWYGRLQLLFDVSLCKSGHQNDEVSHIHESLALINSVDPIARSPDHVMQEEGVPMLCEDADS